MPPKYEIYRPMCMNMLRDRKGFQIGSKFGVDDDIAEALRKAWAAREKDSMLSALFFHLGLTAYQWTMVQDPTAAEIGLVEAWARRHRFPTAIVEDASLVEFLEHSRFSVHPDAFRVPFPGGVVQFSFPKGTKYRGVPVPALLFSYNRFQPLLRNAISLVREWEEAGFISTLIADEFREAYRTEMERTSRTEEVFLCRCFSSRTGGYQKSSFPAHELCEYIDEKSDYDGEALNLQPVLVAGKALASTIPTEEEHELMRLFARLCTGLCIYACAVPEALVPGLPGTLRLRDLHQGKAKPKNVWSLKAPERRTREDRRSPAGHIRSGHFRSLQDERYKRNPDGSIRIVWVREALVNAEIDPHTLRNV